MTLNQGPFARPALPGFSATTGPSATPHGRACSSPSARWESRAPTGRASRVACRFPFPTCHRQYPGGTGRAMSLVARPAAAFPVGPAGRLPHCAFRGLLGVHSRYGLQGRWLPDGAVSWSASAQVVTSLSRPRCYRLERPVTGRVSHPLESTRLCTARGPTRATGIGLPALVDVSEAGWQNCSARAGGADRSLLTGLSSVQISLGLADDPPRTLTMLD